MTTFEFIQKDASLGMLGLFRIYNEDIIVGIGDPSPGLDSKKIDKEVQYYLGLIDRESYHSIVDVRKIHKSNKATRDWIHGEISKRVVKTYAIVARNPITYLLASLGLRLKGLYLPNKLFRDFDAALAWTLEQKKIGEFKSTRKSLLRLIQLTLEQLQESGRFKIGVG